MNLNNNKFKPGLYCVATPIGNMGDITLRAIETLKQSDLILCEDTRVSKKILQKFEINKKIISNHKFNEKKNLEKVLELLKNRKVISLISDAGTLKRVDYSYLKSTVVNRPNATAEIMGRSLSKYSRVGLWSIGGKTRKKKSP